MTDVQNLEKWKVKTLSSKRRVTLVLQRGRTSQLMEQVKNPLSLLIPFRIIERGDKLRKQRFPLCFSNFSLSLSFHNCKDRLDESQFHQDASDPRLT